MNSVNQCIQLFPSIVERQRNSCSSGNTIMLHDWLGAVVAGSYADTLQVENGSDIMRVDSIQNKGDDTSLFTRSPNDSQVGDFIQQGRCVLQELVFIGCYLVKAKPCQIIDGRAQPDDSCN